MSAQAMMHEPVVVLVVQFGDTLNVLPKTAVLELWLVVAYAAFQWIVSSGFLFIRKRAKNRAVYYAAILLALVPLALRIVTVWPR